MTRPAHTYRGAETLLDRPTDWRDRAACQGVDIDLFYPPEGMRGNQRAELEAEAITICGRCPVLTQCRAASRGEKYGVWGGTTPEDRGYNGNGEKSRRRA